MEWGEQPAYGRPDEAGDCGVRVAIAGLIGYALVVYVLLSSTPLRWLDALFLAALIELLPMFAVVQVDLARDLAVARAQAYITSAVTVLFLGFLSLALGSRLVGMEAMGLRIEPGRVAYALSWGAGTFALGMATLWFFLVIRKRGGWGESRLVRELMPVTRREKVLYAGLSFCAGFGEEFGLPGVCDSRSVPSGRVSSGGPRGDVGGFRGPAFVSGRIGGRANWSGRDDHGYGIPPYGKRVAADGRSHFDRPCRGLFLADRLLS